MGIKRDVAAFRYNRNRPTVCRPNAPHAVDTSTLENRPKRALLAALCSRRKATRFERETREREYPLRLDSQSATRR